MSYSDILKLEGRKIPNPELVMDSAGIAEKLEKPDLKSKSHSPLPEASLDVYSDDFEKKEKQKLEQPELKNIKTIEYILFIIS